MKERFVCTRCGAIVSEPQPISGYKAPVECYKDQCGCGKCPPKTSFLQLTGDKKSIDDFRTERFECIRCGAHIEEYQPDTGVNYPRECYAHQGGCGKHGKKYFRRCKDYEESKVNNAVSPPNLEPPSKKQIESDIDRLVQLRIKQQKVQEEYEALRKSVGQRMARGEGTKVQGGKSNIERHHCPYPNCDFQSTRIQAVNGHIRFKHEVNGEYLGNDDGGTDEPTVELAPAKTPKQLTHKSLVINEGLLKEVFGALKHNKIISTRRIATTVMKKHYPNAKLVSRKRYAQIYIKRLKEMGAIRVENGKVKKEPSKPLGAEERKFKEDRFLSLGPIMKYDSDNFIYYTNPYNEIVRSLRVGDSITRENIYPILAKYYTWLKPTSLEVYVDKYATRLVKNGILARNGAKEVEDSEKPYRLREYKALKGMVRVTPETVSPEELQRAAEEQRNLTRDLMG